MHIANRDRYTRTESLNGTSGSGNRLRLEARVEVYRVNSKFCRHPRFLPARKCVLAMASRLPLALGWSAIEILDQDKTSCRPFVVTSTYKLRLLELIELCS